MKPSGIFTIRLFSIGIILFALVLVGRLYVLQVVSGEEFSSRADRQYLQSSYDYYDRGGIFFTPKEGEPVPAAFLRTGFLLAINPSLIEDPESTYQALASVIEIDRADFIAKASLTEDPYEEIANRVSSESADAIRALDLRGVSLYRERWRYYPGNTMGAHVLGFIAYNDDVLAGRYGLERQYEDVLARNNDSVFVNFFAEIFSNIQQRVSGNSELEGDVITTIEPTVQGYLEEELRKVTDNWSSDYTGGIIMHPKTGAIYAMALYPTFDLNNFQSTADPTLFQNYLIESVYEMGSIIKPITLAAAIDAGVINRKTTYFDAGSITLNNRTISNYDGRARGLTDMQQVLSQSLNTGVAFAVQQMGNTTFREYMEKLEIGMETGVDLPNEAYGLVNNLTSTRDIEYVTASYGQGIALTPIATVRALSALANGGVLPNPHIVSRIDYRIGGSKKITPNPPKRVFSEETSEEITRMLVEVVDTALLNGAAKNPNYSVAAKTGTAQVANPNGGGYYEDVYLHSFFGYLPAYDPEFIVFLYTMNPKGVRYASETLTHSFLDITKFLINYYNIPPDRQSL